MLALLCDDTAIDGCDAPDGHGSHVMSCLFSCLFVVSLRGSYFHGGDRMEFLPSNTWLTNLEKQVS